MVRRNQVGGPVLVLALLAGSASCTARDDVEGAGDPPSGRPSSQHGGSVKGTPVGAKSPMAVHTRVTRVAGRVPADARERLVARADRIVTAYLEGLVNGSGDPYADFEPGARRLARDSHPARVPGQLRAGRAAAYLAVLAPEGRLLGATARFQVPLLPQRGGSRRPVAELAGRLLLTPTRTGWRVFGYDVRWPDGRRSRLEGPR